MSQALLQCTPQACTKDKAHVIGRVIAVVIVVVIVVVMSTKIATSPALGT